VNGAGLFSEYISVDFSVAEVFGKKFNTEVITVRTPSGSTACGYPFKEGVEYLVFARGLETNLVTSKCSRTQPAVTATAVLRQLRAIKAGRPVAQIYGFIGTEPYPGVSPLSRLSAKAVGSIPIMAVGPRGEFATSSRPDGSFEFTGLPASTYSIQAKLPADLFIWFARGILERKFEVRPGMTCEADIPLYPKNDPFGRWTGARFDFGTDGYRPYSSHANASENSTGQIDPPRSASDSRRMNNKHALGKEMRGRSVGYYDGSASIDKR
jgi:hypothetical protein